MVPGTTDVRAAPIINASTHEYVTMLTASDALQAMLLGHGTSYSVTVGAWCIAHSTSGNNFRFVNASDSLLSACAMMRDDGIDRVPILSDRTLLCVLDYGRVLRFLHGELANEEDATTRRLFNVSIGQLGLGAVETVVSVRETDSVLETLRVLKERNLEAVPVVDAEGRLRNVFSRSDAAILPAGEWGAGIVERPVMEILNRVRAQGFTVSTCRRSECLGEVLRRFQATHRHRMYLVEDDNSLAGVVTLKQVLRFFLEGC